VRRTVIELSSAFPIEIPLNSEQFVAHRRELLHLLQAARSGTCEGATQVQAKPALALAITTASTAPLAIHCLVRRPRYSPSFDNCGCIKKRHVTQAGSARRVH